MASLKRKPREPFPYVLLADREQPEAEQARFIIRPPSERAWMAMLDEAGGEHTRLFEAVAQFVDRLENHPDADAFGKPNTEARRAFLDETGFDVIRELGNTVALTLLAEHERKN